MKLTQRGEDATLLLHDVHGEYTQPLLNLPVYGESGTDDFVRCEVIWDQYELEFTLNDLGMKEGEAEDRVEGAFRLLFQDKLDTLIDGGPPYTIWKIHGNQKGLMRAFGVLRDALMPRLNDGGSITDPFWMPSGDDDVYDYWPNTMDMLWDFAQNLDDMYSTDHCKKAVWGIMDAMRKIARWDDLLPGGEQEFEWNASGRWGYEA